MVEVWWPLLAAAVPALIGGQALRIKKRRGEEERIKSARGRERSSDEIFVCERVCTSKRMLKKVGAFSKDPIPDTCVTVCGVSELDACSDACARTVCVNQHQVANWNDICLRRCQTECLKLSSSSSSSSRSS
uniref:Thionin-like protein 2 n=1 Tax=Noccaea caerulescens TaxID=107243 RepID=A0A1J3CIF8_NOCCA